MEGRGTGRRVTMRAAADELGVSVEAIRKRVQRGSIRSDKAPDGRRYVYLDAGRDPSEAFGAPVELVDVLRAQVEDLRADRDAWRDQARRSDYMASAALDRTRELEGRLRELEAPASTDHRPQQAQSGTEGLPWWRRIFGG